MSDKLINVSNLCGTAETASVLGVLKQRIHTLRKRDDFPKPLIILAATPLWDKDELIWFKNNWKKTTTPEVTTTQEETITE